VTVYWENGKVMRVGFYKDGQWDGVWNDLGGNGWVKSERFFKNGQEEGTSKYYRNTGKVKGEFVYKNGKLLSSQEYYSAGNLSKECDYKNGKVCKEFLEIRPQDFIEQIEKKLAAIQDISYVLSTSSRPQSDENAVWTETLRTGHWYKAPNLAKNDSIQLNLPEKPESHWIFKMEDNSLMAYEILKDGSVTKKAYPADAWASVGPPRMLISDLKRRMAGNLRSVSYDYDRKVHIITFDSPDQCVYEISDDTGLPLLMTISTSDQEGVKVVRVQMTDIRINTGMADEVFRVPEKANAAPAAGPSR
jgi:outer membrane lipoprotein-sorting protein